MKTKLTAFTLLLILCVAQARLVRTYSHEEMTAQADVVAVIEAISTEKSDIVPPFKEARTGHPREDFQAWVTTFKVLTMLKGRQVEGKPFQIVHFTYSDRVNLVANGATFIQFAIGPIEREVKTTENGKSKGTRTQFKLQPQWLAYLKARDDGRYEAVSGQYDSATSFRELSDAQTAFH